MIGGGGSTVAANASASNASDGKADERTSAMDFSLSCHFHSHLHRHKYHRQRDDVVKRAARDPKQNYADNVLEDDIRISKKYLKRQTARRLRDLAENRDYIDVMEEHMAHLSIGEKCTEYRKL